MVLRLHALSWLGILLFGCGGAVAGTNNQGAGGSGNDSADAGGEDASVDNSGGASGAAGSGSGGAPGDPPCAVGFGSCDGECVDLYTDPWHCGTCSVTCLAGERCASGVCDPGTGLNPGPCLPNEVDCPLWGCVDTSNNVLTCGGCSVACLRGEMCIEGGCVRPDCAEAETFCPHVGCVDLQSNRDACGSCNELCGVDAECVDGGCVPPECAPGQTYCSSFGCIDLTTSEVACGSCQSGPCRAPRNCIDGRCVEPECAAGEIFCEYSGCVDLSASSNACGQCGNPCNGVATCDDGECICHAPFVDCDGYCADLTTDFHNCGRCERSCRNFRLYECVDGQCACTDDTVRCGDACAAEFWYCPTASPGTSPLAACHARADEDVEHCVCDECIDLLVECAASAECIEAVDCALEADCWPHCSQPLALCDPDASEALRVLECLNARCIAQ